MLVKKAAVINDISGFGRCSLSVALPILSVMGVQCCALPTAILSNHTGYDSYFFDDYTDKMKPYYEEWCKLNIHLDTIYTGFLGCHKQIDIVSDFFARLGKDAVIIVDPVMGDDGKLYVTYTPDMCNRMRQLVQQADIITPNITEACILTDTPYQGEDISKTQAAEMAQKLAGQDARRTVIITGIQAGEQVSTYVYDAACKRDFSVTNPRTVLQYPGTGDVFASVLCAAVTIGLPLDQAVFKATDFVARATAYTSQFDQPVNDGIIFEPLLGTLIQ